ncbi:hypothetical protein FGO68_gene2342 [Halteria grandinella]|uniref:Uncharacterized protein n=1 Tax=Halteria grandinella TaxID=5974 RepID=A0A8J8NWW5_HALGN|nr:hypothetical protein FGO68_gene2342 [Halteria grandinella]
MEEIEDIDQGSNQEYSQQIEERVSIEHYDIQQTLNSQELPCLPKLFKNESDQFSDVDYQNSEHDQSQDEVDHQDKNNDDQFDEQQNSVKDIRKQFSQNSVQKSNGDRILKKFSVGKFVIQYLRILKGDKELECLIDPEL